MNLNAAIPVLTVMLVTVAQPCDVATQSMPSDQEIPQLEFERRDAILRDGIATLDRLLASSLTTTTANGAIVGSLRNSTSTRTISKVIAWDFEELNVRVYGDAAVSTIRAKFTDILRGKRRTEDQQLTHVWVNLDGR